MINPISMKNPQMKRPNTIANKHIHNASSGQKPPTHNTQQFDINGIKLSSDKEGGTIGSGSGGYNTPTDKYNSEKQPNHKNMNEIYDMLEKYAQNRGTQ